MQKLSILLVSTMLFIINPCLIAKDHDMQEKTTTTIQEIKAGSIYKHYSGNLYKVLAIVVDTEAPDATSRRINSQKDITDSCKRVIYQAVGKDFTPTNDIVWDRPYTMFAEKIVIDGKEQWRFTLAY